MALTPEQKEANKEARRIRDRAFNARYKEHRDKLNAEKEAALAAIKPEFDAASTVKDAIEAERVATLNAFNERIAELTAERDAALEAIRLRYIVARDARSQIWDRKMAADKEIERRLDLEYPDLVGTYGSAAAWEKRRQVAAAPGPTP